MHIILTGYSGRKEEYMLISIPLDCFINDNDFPFFIQNGSHDADLYMHSHLDYTELVIVLSGTAIHKVNNESYFIKKGDVFVISDDTIHGYENTNNFRICNIMYRANRLSGFHTEVRKLPGFHALFMLEPYFSKEHGFQSKLRLKLGHFEYVNTILSNILTEYEQQVCGWRDMIDSYFTQLVVYLSRIYTQTNDNTLTSDNTSTNIINIANSLSYIESNFMEQITVEQLAARSHVSVRHFSRIFKATYNTSPSIYILSLRLEYACVLLKTTNHNISEIALQSGFTNSNYFTRQFHKKFQITPKEYRNQNK